MSINSLVREGNLTKDVVFFAGDGDKKKSFASVRMASYGGKNTSDEKLTIYASVKAYGYLADQIKDLQKGDTVIVAGRVVSDPYEKDGHTVESESIIASDISYRKKGEATSETKPQKKTKTKDQSEEVPF